MNYEAMALGASSGFAGFLVMGARVRWCDTSATDGWPCARMYVLGTGLRSGVSCGSGTLLA